MKQKDALEILKTGENVYLTGQAGSGKTYLLNQYIEYLKKNKIGVAVTASTGIAATHLNGITIHSWSGIGVDKVIKPRNLGKLLGNDTMKDRYRNTKVLFIDEISMLDADRLDLLNSLCQAFKKSVSPFGGMQVVFCGDFFQLPPVSTRDEKNDYAFMAEIWNNMDLKICYLSEQFRQEDGELVGILNNIRSNKVNRDDIFCLKNRMRKLIDKKSTATKLYTINRNVDVMNLYELTKIKSDEKVFEMISECDKGKEIFGNFLKKSCTAPERLTLKVGAVVMFVKNNFDAYGHMQYANGTLGKVVGFSKGSGHPIVETNKGDVIVAQPTRWVVEEHDRVVASATQVPLRLAWAITIHKSQGMSLDEVELDLGGAFDYGMGYVALSRVRTLAGMNILGINKKALEVNPRVLNLDKELIQSSKEVMRKYRDFKKSDITVKKKEFLLWAKSKEEDGMF